MLVVIVLSLLMLFDSCTTLTQYTKPTGSSIIKGKEFIIVTVGKKDTLRSLAKTHLGDESKYWVISDFNDISTIKVGDEVVIPTSSQNQVGVNTSGYQTVPILCYHRFGHNRSRMTVTPKSFEKQMAYLFNNGYHVIKMSDMTGYLNGQLSIPKKSVIITADDGYKSVYRYAYPILRKYQFPATIFVYSDYIGSQGGLNWREMEEMVNSGLIDIQAHSKTHRNLGIPKKDEINQSLYTQRIEQEIIHPSVQIEAHLDLPLHTFAYPYGDTNETVIKNLEFQQYDLGVTVHPGGNPSFAFPYMLNRTMIFGNNDMQDFISSLQTFTKIDLR